MTSNRDTFAAAALAGLLAQGDDGSFSEESYARAAYRWADAMLRERTNHDAVPAARASDGRPRTDKADLPTRAGAGDTPVTEPMPKEKRAEVSVRIDGPDPDSRVFETHTPPAQPTPDESSQPREGTPEPVAWGVADHTGILCTSTCRSDAEEMCAEFAVATTVVPLYRSPALTDAEREAVRFCAELCRLGERADLADTLRGLLTRPCVSVGSETPGEPVAWAALRDDGDIAWIGYTREGAADGACGRKIVPLYRQPQDGVVRLPALDPNGDPGWNAAIGAVRQLLADAGVDWDTE